LFFATKILFKMKKIFLCQSTKIVFLTVWDKFSGGCAGRGGNCAMRTLGARIRFARGRISQDTFSGMIGVSKGSLGGYERDENLPNTDVVLKICRQTGISVEWLLTGGGAALPVATEAEATAPLACEPLATAPLAAPKVYAQEAIAQEAIAPQTPAAREDRPPCARCVKLEQAMEKLNEERRDLNAENRRLWKENSRLAVRLARLKTWGNTRARTG
jgi:transcriptional regulator with XRE-family HTH domain